MEINEGRQTNPQTRGVNIIMAARDKALTIFSIVFKPQNKIPTLTKGSQCGFCTDSR
jgi:hypothetical protein